MQVKKDKEGRESVAIFYWVVRELNKVSEQRHGRRE